MISIRKYFQGDRTIWFIFFALCIVSIVEVYSAGSTLSYKTGNYLSPLLKQALFLAIGSVFTFVIHIVPYRFFKILPLFLWPLSVVLLFVALASGSEINDTGRWIVLPGGFTFQPSELAKGVVVLTVALILSNKQREKSADRNAIKWILFVTAFPCLLIFTENLSTAAMLFAVVYIMMWIGRIPFIQLAKLAGSLILLVVLVFTVSWLSPKESVLHRKVFHRVETWAGRMESFTADKGDEKTAVVNGEATDSTAVKKNMRDNTQETVARIAIATSNYGIGKMPGNSVERDFLSQAYSDFIFAIIIEETGLWGAFFVMLMYVMLLFRAGRIASKCERNFPAFLIMGLAIMLVFQACINTMVAVGLFPVTGQPLPLVSRGGTSTLITCMYFGMMLSVSRYAIKKKGEYTEEDEEKDVFMEEAQTSPQA